MKREAFEAEYIAGLVDMSKIHNDRCPFRGTSEHCDCPSGVSWSSVGTVSVEEAEYFVAVLSEAIARAKYKNSTTI